MPTNKDSHWRFHGVRTRLSTSSLGVAHITPLLPIAELEARKIQSLLERLALMGTTNVFTSAISRSQQSFFETLGFEPYDDLELLSHDLSSPIFKLKERLDRGRRSDWQRILDADNAAFSGFWKLDQSGLLEALNATLRTRVRLHQSSDLHGFAITGRTGRSAFLQRLAVKPVHQGIGVGRCLVADALNWAKRRSVREVLVNTQSNNHAALNLYQSMGFTVKNDGLVVLQWSPVT